MNNQSEIINKKKQYIFEVNQTSDFVFPNEVFNYYIYIKNISGTLIEDFTIKIENSEGVIFKTNNFGHKGITIKNGEALLYEMQAYCTTIGEHVVHFIGYGEGVELIYRTLKINCTRTYNSDKLLHRLNIYDFTPYEEKYSLEAKDYNDSTTQIFKKQKLPYKAGEQPFGMEQDFVPENIESLSFIEQYQKAKNTNEHVYQYIGRENFTEDAIESYTGENLFEIFEKINKQSEYFKGKFFRSGTNHLLNDFTQYAPNGFIHRMGLLNSEIYHALGVIPTYSYMSDKLFRWAPAEKQLLNLTPKKVAMRWNQNIWAGKGWFVYRVLREEYLNSEEYQKEKEQNSVVETELMGDFEDLKTAEECVAKLKRWDEIQKNRTKQQPNYEYEIVESLYDTGVFYINIPLNKIPSNFYMLNNKSLLALINRAKPYGTKPIINYIIEETFNQNMEQTLVLNYYEKPIFDMKMELGDYNITQYEYTNITKECGGIEYTYPSLSPRRIAMSSNFLIDDDMDMDVDYSQVGMRDEFDSDMQQEYRAYQTKCDFRLNTLKQLLELIYQQNYNNISFYIKNKSFDNISEIAPETLIEYEDDYHYIKYKPKGEEEIKTQKIDSLCLLTPKSHNEETILEIKDIFNRKHRISAKYDKNSKMHFINYTYINKNNKSFIQKSGYQNVNEIIVTIGKVHNKKILLFFVKDYETRDIHYFHHVIVQDVYSFSGKRIENENETILNNILIADNLLTKSIIFETPYIKESKTFREDSLIGGSNWINLYRLNDKNNSYAYINNLGNDNVIPKDIILNFNSINIPETAIIETIKLKLNGTSPQSKKVYINNAFNTNYLTQDAPGYKIQLEPKQLECYKYPNESSAYYKIKLDIAEQKEQETLVKRYKELLEENYIFDEDIGIELSQYIDMPNDYVVINKSYWCELSDFTDLKYKLNEIEDINLVIEGYNTQYETKISAQVLFETDTSSTVSEKIPAGYFRKKIPLLFSNQFLLELLRVRFRFNTLNHDIKIFDTRIEIKFKNKKEKSIEYEMIGELMLDNENSIDIVKNYYTPANINNGLSIKLEFDELYPGEYYQLNFVQLEIIYQDTDIDMMITNNYKDIFYGVNQSSILGKAENAYLSGEFYNDVITMGQNENNVGINNRGIKLQKSLYQMFETRDDNITSIELFPYGFRGNPDETIKLGLYTNSQNTPGKLIKEICISGWLKNNEKLKNLDRIKYNFNVNNLEINEKYWFKLEVLNPQENNYYLLKGIDTTKNGFKLLSNENNNYINTFSNLKFNIYSKNLSKSFKNIPVSQEYFDNPFVNIGLHKGQGSIIRLQTDKYIKSINGNDYMGELFENEEPEISVFKIIRKKPNGEEEELPTVGE